MVDTLFDTGELLRQMNITGDYIVLRTYMDAFSANCPIGSSSNKHKILGLTVSNCNMRFWFNLKYFEIKQIARIFKI